MLEKLKQRREILSQIQLKIQQLDAQTKERRGLSLFLCVIFMHN